MASEDDDNPELTEVDFASPCPAADVLPPDFVSAYRGLGRPTGLIKADAKQHITLRLDRDVIERFRARQLGLQARINEVLKPAG